jgi:hypothetical protein
MCRLCYPNGLVSETSVRELIYDKESTDSAENEGRSPGCTIMSPSNAPDVNSRDRAIDPIPPPDDRNLIAELKRPRLTESITSLLALVENSVYLTNSQKSFIHDHVVALPANDQTTLLLALHTRNGDVVSFNDSITHCLGTNSNVAFLGSHEQVMIMLLAVKAIHFTDHFLLMYRLNRRFST